MKSIKSAYRLYFPNSYELQCGGHSALANISNYYSQGKSRKCGKNIALGSDTSLYISIAYSPLWKHFFVEESPYSINYFHNCLNCSTFRTTRMQNTSIRSSRTVGTRTIMYGRSM